MHYTYSKYPPKHKTQPLLQKRTLSLILTSSANSGISVILSNFSFLFYCNSHCFVLYQRRIATTNCTILLTLGSKTTMMVHCAILVSGAKVKLQCAKSFWQPRIFLLAHNLASTRIVIFTNERLSSQGT